MAKSRRNFLASTSISLLAAATACSDKKHESGELPAGTPPAFGTAPPVGPEVSPSTFAEAEKLVQVELRPSDRAVAAGNWRNSMAALYERRTGPRKVALEPALAPWSRWNAVLPGADGWPGSRSLHPQPHRSRTAARTRRGYCLRSGDTAVALDRAAQAHLPAAHADLPGTARTVRSQAALCDHPYARAGAGASADGRRRDRRRQISRAAARESLGRQGPARYRRHLDHVRRGALQEPRSQRGCGGSETSSRCRRGACRQAQHGRFGAERYLVRRPDHEPVAA